MWTISSGLPKRPVGLRARRSCLAASSLTSQSMSSGVSTGPGQIAFVRMPFGPNWTARLRVRLRTAPFDAVYASCGHGAADEGHEARDVDDRAAAGRLHRRDGVLAAEEYAADVDGHDLVPDVDRRCRSPSGPPRASRRRCCRGHRAGRRSRPRDRPSPSRRPRSTRPPGRRSPRRRRRVIRSTVSWPAASPYSATTTLAPSPRTSGPPPGPSRRRAPVMIVTLSASRIAGLVLSRCEPPGCACRRRGPLTRRCPASYPRPSIDRRGRPQRDGPTWRRRDLIDRRRRPATPIASGRCWPPTRRWRRARGDDGRVGLAARPLPLRPGRSRTPCWRRTRISTCSRRRRSATHRPAA